jgi:glycyl-tRNA synthetase
MAPQIRSSKLTLSCPLFAADFDPQNNDFLLVGGGGGESRSGVGNQIASRILAAGLLKCPAVANMSGYINSSS